MALAAIELNDSAVTLARDGALIARSPGFALLDGDTLTVGEDALRQARLKPRMVSNRFWERLSNESVAPALPAGWTYADLARAHISWIWDRAGARVDDLVLVVPGHFDRLQLGLLLGVTEQLALPVRGMVDSALVACEAHGGADFIVHVAVHLHRTVVSGVELGDGARRVFAHSIEGHGLVQLHQRCIELIAEMFVETTRFDPLHSAESEQAIYDRLPGWLATLVSKDSLRIEMAGRDGATRAIELTRSRVEKCARELSDALRAVIVRHCSQRQFVLELEDGAARFPGLASSVLSGTDGRVVRLPPGAAALGALRRAPWIVRPDWRNTLMLSLPRDAFEKGGITETSQ